MNLSTNLEMQELHDIWRKSALQFVVLDFIILDIVRRIRGLVPTTILTTTPIAQIEIEDPYLVKESPIFGVPKIPTLLGAATFLEDQFNLGNVSRNLFQAIKSFPSPAMPPVIDEVLFLQYIKLYTDYRVAVFIQQLLSYVLINPQVLRGFQKLEDKIKVDTIRNKLKGVRLGQYDYETENLTDGIILLINNFGTVTDRNEDTLKILLTDIDISATRNWNTIGNPSVPLPPGATRLPQEDAKKFAQLVGIFQLLSNTLKENLISGIQANLVPATTTTPQVNDIARVSLDVHGLNTIGQIWKEIFSSPGEPPSVIIFLRNEISKIFDSFENSKSASGMEQHIAISKDRVKKFLETVLEANTDAKLTDLSNQPSSDAFLSNFRSLQVSKTDNLPAPRHLNFLYTIWWILKETPILAEFHERAELFIDGWDASGNPKSPRLFPTNLCSQIFPDIVDKRVADITLGTISLERIFNSRKKSFGELNRQIQLPEGLPSMLLKARGISL